MELSSGNRDEEIVRAELPSRLLKLQDCRQTVVQPTRYKCTSEQKASNNHFENPVHDWATW